MVQFPSLRSLLFVLPLPFALVAHGQQATTKEGYALEWNKTITVVADSLTNRTHRLPAWTITVFETDGGELLDLWKSDMKALSVAVTGSKPVKAAGARITDVPGSTVAFATSTTDKKAKLARLTIAFGANDSTATPSNEGQESYVRGLAVKYNRAVVQAQIATYEKTLGKATGKLSSSQADVSKTRQNITKANGKLEKLKAKRGKVQGDIAHLQGDITGLEKKFALTNEPKDLEKLTKARGKLAKSEGSLAKLMTTEADVQGDLAKYQGQLDENSSEAQDRTATKEGVQHTVDALKRKLDAIR